MYNVMWFGEGVAMIQNYTGQLYEAREAIVHRLASDRRSIELPAHNNYTQIPKCSVWFPCHLGSERNLEPSLCLFCIFLRVELVK